METSLHDFRKVLEAFSYFPGFVENHNSVAFRTHWNSEITARDALILSMHTQAMSYIGKAKK